MSDELTVSGGGSTRVETEELVAEVGRLGAADARCRLLDERAGRLVAMLGNTGAFFGRAEHELFVAGYQLGEAARVAGGLSTSLLQAAERYGATERRLLAIRTIAEQIGAWSLGATARLAAPLAVPVMLTAAEAMVIGDLAMKLLGIDTEAAHDAGLQRLLSTPGLAEALGVSLDSLDEFVMGLAGVPPVGQLSGIDMKAPDNAAVLLGAAGVIAPLTGGLLVERPVTVRRADGVGAASGADAARAAPTGRQVAAPTTLAELAERVPHGGDGDPQVRVERYPDGDTTKWIVYVGGTIDFSLAGGSQPYDMTSNLHVVAERSPLYDDLVGPGHGAGEAAVRLAMEEAGVQPGDEIVGVGYSGGGAVIGNLMRDPELNMVAGMNLGGPARVDAGGSLLNVEHSNEPVPGSGGAVRPDGPLTITREVDLAAEPSDLAAPAHDLEAYRRTAALGDECDDPRVVGVRTSFTEFAGGLTGTQTMWVAERAAPPAHRAIEPPLPADPATAPNFAAG